MPESSRSGADAGNPRVLLAVTPAPELKALLDARYDTCGPLGRPIVAALDALAEAVRAQIRVVVTVGSLTIGGDAMARLPDLGLICCIGSGYEGVDLAAARARAIRVAHSPGANAVSVAEVAMGLLIASMRGFRAESTRLADGSWQVNADERGSARSGLAGRRLGIFGMGAIGREVAVRARAFAMTIGYHNRQRLEAGAGRYFGSLEALAAWCDALVISVRAGATTRHAVNARILDALGPEAHIVNIARGSVIDERALVDALQSRRIAGAGLDVYEHEPDVPHALLQLANVVALPHIGGSTDDARAAMAAMVIANLDAFFAGSALPTPVPM